MDSLTHGLLGLAIGAARPVDRDRPAVLLACVLAAELPDLDYVLPAENAALHALKAHRGLSHALLAAPLVALAATGLAMLVFRRAKFVSLYGWSLLAVVLAHLLADAWTGWGTRLLLPFSDARVTLDWMMVVDPLFTLPLLVGALWGLRRRTLVRRALLTGLAVSCGYLGLRIGASAMLGARVEERYTGAERQAVFPSWLGPLRWRYVAVYPEKLVVGQADLFGPITEQGVHARRYPGALSPRALANTTVQEALAWARFPLLHQEDVASGERIHVADLRYHLNGEPTLSFTIDLDSGGRTLAAALERGGSARSLWERSRSGAESGRQD